jgi:hypothetical protein
VEQDGPIRVVVRVEGRHAAPDEQWLPFSLRLYFHAGSASVRIVHSLIFDGDPARRFVRGLGLSGQVPMTDPLGTSMSASPGRAMACGRRRSGR